MDKINIFVSNLESPSRKSRLIPQRNELEFALDATKHIQKAVLELALIKLIKVYGKFQISFMTLINS